ncbi:hypothetical protein TM49_05225 [Martelella endophytica]|uniref:Radical SAM core domain-containing protein n=1 Tax=Martelella endophytica TaxID=1486262 RepID=A0A0D5LX12_MAREN|nr:hypothetical protein TM49_05225 [Martelella endophytica]
MANDLRIGGFEPFSLCDWPGKIVATLFLQGCPWRCPYCHNPGLIDANAETAHRLSDILEFLETRRGLLDGVVFSGGEPTLQRALVPTMEAVRAMGFAVGLHSAGPYPERLKAALPHADWIGLDIKAPEACYDRMTGTPKSATRAFESLRHVLASGIAYEVRTTVHDGLMREPELAALRQELAASGIAAHKIQTFREAGVDRQRLAAALRQQRG